jgi:hypothetical protein
VRRLLVVLVLMISSVLLLQAPAWAPHLYRLKRIDGDGGRNATWTAYINCRPGLRAVISSGAFTGSPKAIVQPSHLRGYQGKVTFFSKMRSSAATRITSVTCSAAATTIPRGGSRVLEQLALGIGLLMLGGLLVMLSAHPSVRRRISHPDPRTPD